MSTQTHQIIIKRFKTSVMSLFIISLSSFSVEAATYYLATNGNDSSSRNGSSSAPWKSLNYAQSRMSTGDDLILKGGSYTITSSQYINKSGTPSNPMVIKAATGASVYLDGGGISQNWTNMLHLDGNHIEFRNIELRNNPRGSGLLIRGDYVLVDNCKSYGHGLVGIQIYGSENTYWQDTPIGCTIQYSSVWDCCKMNDQNFWNYQGWKDQGGFWPFALGAISARNAKVLHCWSSDNHGEGIVLSRVRGALSEISGCQARDNYSINIYCDGTSGDGATNDWVDIKNNSAWTTNKAEFYRSGGPAHNFGISAENYDSSNPNAPVLPNKDILRSNATRYVNLINNYADKGGHNYIIFDSGKPISDIWVDGNTATTSWWYDNFKINYTANISNIWFGTNTGF
jgi:hypothetical protein